jgi:hypothetical protein
MTTDISDRDTKGRFLTGNGGGGRKPGSRNRLGEAFIEAIAEDFADHGEEVIKTVRMRQPSDYLKLVANVLPKEIIARTFSMNVDASLDLDAMAEAKGFLAAYRMARDYIGAEPEPELIEAEPVEQTDE